MVDFSRVTGPDSYMPSAGKYDARLEPNTLTGATPLKMTAFSSVEEAMRHAIELRERINRMVNRLTGSRPISENTRPTNPDPHGLLEEVEHQARLIIGMCELAHDDLSYLESKLP